MSLYLRSAFGSRVTGNVLHLHVADRNSVADVAVCGSPIGGRWRRTGPGVRGWQRHAHWPVCTRCIRALAELRAALVEQEQRHAPPLYDASLPERTARVEPDDTVRGYDESPDAAIERVLSGPGDVPQYDSAAVPAHPED